MKKFLLFLVFSLTLLFTTAAAFGEYDFDTAYNKWEKFSGNLMNFADNIVANNKHVCENKLTKKERFFNDEFTGTGTSPVIWQRVWAKNKTIVTAWAKSDKKFHADSIETIDPDFVFMNGIHVGGSIKDLEKYFGAPIDKINESSKAGIIYGSSQSESGHMVLITYDNRNIITKISVHMLHWVGDFPVPSSEKTDLFIKNKKRELQIPENPEPF